MTADDHPVARPRVGTVLFGAGAFAGGLALLLLAWHEKGDTAFSPANERFAPIVVTGLWTVLSALYLVGQLTRFVRGVAAAKTAAVPAETDDAADDPAEVHWRAPLLMVVALVAYVLLLEPVGFLITTFAFYVAAAAILGSRVWWRELVIGAAMSAVIYFSFTYLLELTLPPGVLPL
ncbi:MAG TPA: tripartite tricarboxylate transporter TctB family protein [Stackebrandtia sp.]|jgi:putative tricarboxylic transport membrane protein|uniref:tripartite tricarboxylate transporter TctB family protein n=1 Tax=Stackebrandtia sp. TaxID=2023065 RepID=UPI002D4EA4DB|nr:tripartite tricarboxylate transporter TctB family protein [Stackebrandtia sp.]HZE41445.1 tripartite tricarboxylate transporter TctB family protein [Stackebrandtia sp.]